MEQRPQGVSQEEGSLGFLVPEQFIKPKFTGKIIKSIFKTDTKLFVFHKKEWYNQVGNTSMS